MASLFGAIDLGASSGRVIAGVLSEGKLSLSEVHRFPNGAKELGSRLVWDFDLLLAEIRIGLRELGARAERLGLDVTSIGIDTWAVDYGLVKNGQLLTQPNCYRAPQNELGVRQVHEKVSFSEIYSVSGLQFLPFNTIYQLSKHQELFGSELADADQILLLPDLIGFFLTGELATERTNASSTGLLDAQTREWSYDLAQKAGVDISKFPPLRSAGETLGTLVAGFGRRLEETKVVLVGSHDTASAVVGVPAIEPNFAFLSSGTWSLLGAEIPEPVLTPESREANFTNELGVDNRVRYLKNLSGLWLLSESMRFWAESGNPQSLSTLLTEAAKIQPESLIDVGDPDFIAPGDMPLKIARQLQKLGKPVPKSPAAYTALILHSLASSYAFAVTDLEALTDTSYEVIHVIGGGSQNELLSQLTADYCGKTVIAGPVEATALGNLLVQIRSAGLGGETLEDLRTLLLKSDIPTKTYV